MREMGRRAKRERNKDRRAKRTRGTETRFITLRRVVFACYSAEHTCSLFNTALFCVLQVIYASSFVFLTSKLKYPPLPKNYLKCHSKVSSLWHKYLNMISQKVRFSLLRLLISRRTSFVIVEVKSEKIHGKSFCKIHWNKGFKVALAIDRADL